MCRDLASSGGQDERDRSGRIAGQVFIFALPSSFTCVVSQVKWAVIIRLKPLSHAFCEGRSVGPASSFLPPDSPRPQLGPFIFHRPEESARNPNHRHKLQIARLKSLYLPDIRKRGWGCVSPIIPSSSLPVFCVLVASSIAAATCRLFFSLALFYARAPFVFSSLQPLSQKQGGGQGPLSGSVRGHETRDVTGWRRRGASRPANAKPPKSSEA